MNADSMRSTNGKGVRLDDFYAYMPMHSYIYAPTRELWPASSVNAPAAANEGRQGEPMA